MTIKKAERGGREDLESGIPSLSPDECLNGLSGWRPRFIVRLLRLAPVDVRDAYAGCRPRSIARLARLALLPFHSSFFIPHPSSLVFMDSAF
jgi:hypothetical protein